jgi:large subunit ribosomal protein L7/L12
MANLSQLVTDLSALTVLEAAELSKMLEEKWGVSAAAPVAVAAAAGAAPAAAAAEAKTDFDLVITKAGDKKINVIKEVRAITNLGLKEAKDLVDAADKEAKVVKEGMPKADADKAKKLLEDAGATVELR